MTTTRTRRPYAARVPLEQRREQLLDATIAIIARDGYDALSIEAIAREAGVTRPVVYGAFDGLRTLLLTLLDRQEQRALAQLTDLLPDNPDLSSPIDFAAETVRRMFAVINDDPLTWRPVLFAMQDAPAEVRERVAADWERVRAQIQGLLDLGLAMGGRSGLDTEVLSHAVMAILEHFGRVVLDQPDLFDVERLVATVRQLIGTLLS